MTTWTYDDWWKEFPYEGHHFRYKVWERKNLGVIGKIFPGSIIDGLGYTNTRVFANEINTIYKWDPFNYKPLNYFIDHPLAGELEEIVIDDALSRGSLQFYVYLTMDNVCVNYEKIRTKDRFFLRIPEGCEEMNGETVNLKIIEPPNPEYQGVHQVFYASWDNGYAFSMLALPVFLEIDRNELLKIKKVFEDHQVNTIKYDLHYYYPKEFINQLSPYHPFVVKSETSENVLCILRGFLTFGRKRRYIRFLVASDIHVAERNDTIQSKAGDWGIELPPHGRFCNYNEQARNLSKQAFDLWKNGNIDYIFLVGDLVDFALKDSKVNTQIDFLPTSSFADQPRPYGMGESAFNLSNALDEDSSSREAFDSDSNLNNIRDVIDKLSRFENTNWDVFHKIFGNLMGCMNTILVPGNHDYIVFGSELSGIEKDTFHEFLNNIVNISEAEAIPWLSSTGRAAALGVLRFLGWIDDPTMPGYESMATYHDMGITKDQADLYDATRTLRSHYRPLLGAFWDHSARSGLNRTRDFINTGNGAFKIRTATGWLRFVWLDAGPGWNQLVNSSPWLTGFPDPEKGNNELLNQLEKLRENTDDMLVLFMHSPPLSRRYHHTGTPADYCFKMTNYLINGISSNDNWPNKPYELSNIWKVRALEQTALNLSNDPFWGAPFHGHERLLSILTPEVFTGCHHHTDDESAPEHLEIINTREQPMITFSGHTHWRHTYSLQKFVKGGCYEGDQGCVHFLAGNELISEMLDRTNLIDWWRKRSLIATVGCVGPIPPGEFKKDVDGKMRKLEQGDAGYMQPDEVQGFYIVTVDIEQGVICNIEWKKMYYAAAND